MKKLIINKCMELVTTYNKDLSQRDIDKIKYGLEGLYLTITKLIFIIIVSIILGIWKETLLLILIFNGIRLTAFGVHAKRSIDCLISSTLFFILFPIICIKLTIPLIVKVILFIPLTVLIGIFAPADTEKRPLINKKKRKIYKILSIIISIIYMTIAIVIKDNTLSNCFIFAIVIQIIIMLPITYKIFGVSYNNYKTYEVK
ncbi:putative agrB-like protein putative [Clostridium sp. CAG:433]|nr:putative agrB-like protein putative [Clostridium sp. CAG:433]